MTVASTKVTVPLTREIGTMPGLATWVSSPVPTGHAQDAAAVPPGAACWTPSGHGWRRRAPGKESGKQRQDHLNRRQGDVIHLLEKPSRNPGGNEQNQIGLDASIGFGGDIARGHSHLVFAISRYRSALLPKNEPFSTFQNGVSMKPYSFTRAWVARELIRPAFGPSGVSIGQRRP